ncbi:hypothetical protein LIER_31830 [Lithospermum erythrorhizon]|uniref:Uncharacterized protein n=1 Tax=Lithospermum erythrorhizon TaxID=34254 RepID=A0AAV3RVX3_LITER
MCTYFTSINKDCPKDCYPLPHIDRLVYSSVGYKVVDFLDAFWAYHQILMAEEDVDKTAFVAEYGIYCWKVMAFGLKNVGATYQRMVNKVFSTQIGRNMKIYLANMLIKSRDGPDHEANLRESFDNMRKYNLRLNPNKCVIGVTSGKFLGYMINQKGIEPNPDKIAVVQAMQSPRTQKEKRREFEWTLECEKSFQELKAYLQSPQLLAQSVVGDILQLYLPVSESALSSVLIWEEEKVQKLIYYVSRVMRGAATRYPLMKKPVYALVVVVQKLKPYIEAHPAEVITDQPLRKILEDPSRSGHIVKCAIELSKFDLRYRPQRNIKAQALAEFMVECTHEPDERAPELVSIVEAAKQRV